MNRIYTVSMMVSDPQGQTPKELKETLEGVFEMVNLNVSKLIMLEITPEKTLHD